MCYYLNVHFQVQRVNIEEAILRRMKLIILLYGFLVLQTVKRKKAKWISHIVRRNCLLKHVIEGKIEGRIAVTGRRVRRHKQLLDDVTEGGGYCKLKEEVLDRTVCRTGFGSKYDSVVMADNRIAFYCYRKHI